MRGFVIFLTQVALSGLNILYLNGLLQVEVGTLVALNTLGLVLITAGLCGYLVDIKNK